MTPYVQLAFDFARALATGDFNGAHGCLHPSLQESLDATRLEAQFKDMVEKYSDGFQSADHVEVVETLEDWPAKEPNDLGWAYVSIEGKCARGAWGEAVTVVVADSGDGPRIRTVEWGRP